jgi:serine/threonine protein kinase
MQFWYHGHAIERLGRRYRLDGHLGSGGMAEVCLAWDEREGRRVALKMLKADDLDQESLNRFMKEAAQIVHWRHPHILRVYDTMQIELLDPAHGALLFYFVMEYASGGDLQKRLTPGSPFPLSASFALFRQLCDAVQYAHEHGVVHRDLKPLNILFRRPATGPEQVVLSDFGLAVQVDASHYTFARGGTLGYMAPEQFAGEISPACDIFALGVILYQLCTGRLPFRRQLQDLPRVQDAPPPVRPSRLNPNLPPELDAPILRALHNAPAERYPSARAFWQAIEQALTAVAQTYPFLSRESWLRDGQTWPTSSVTEPSTRAAREAGPLKSSQVRAREPLGASSNPEEPADDALAMEELWKVEPADDALEVDAGGERESVGDALAVEELWNVEVEEDERDTPSRIPRRASALNPPDEARAGTSNPGALGWRWRAAPLRATGDAGGQQVADETARPARPPDTDPRAARTRAGSRRAVPRPGSAPRQRAGSLPFTSVAHDGAAKRRRPQAYPRADAQQPAAALRTARNGGARPPRALKLSRPLMLLGLVVLLGAALLATSLPGSPLRLFGASPAVVTIIPRARLEQNSYQFAAVPATPDPAQRQVPARLLTTTSPAQSATAHASGSLPATRATGQLTFINQTSMDVTLQTTIIKGASGIEVTFQGPVVVPAINPPTATVIGMAVNAGASGNIPQFDIDGFCCAPNNEIVVKNTTAFTGGRDAQPNSVIQQSDIDGAARGLEGTLTQDAQTALQGQVRSGERVADGSLKCQPHVSANHNAGDVAPSATVTVTMTCSEEVYDFAAVQRMAANLLQTQAGSDPNLGSGYALSGGIVVSVLSATLAGAQGQVDLAVQARGLWAYAFSPALLRRLAAQLAGETQAQARALLLQQPGVASVRFNSNSTLPTDSQQIQVVVGAPEGTG